MRILSVGECMAELAPADMSDQFRLGFAGDTFNTAWYIARLWPKIDVAYFTGIGQDAISQQMREFICASKIGDQYIQVMSNHTLGLYLISLDNGERSFSYWRGQSAAKEMARNSDVLNAAFSNVDLIYFSGITLAILDAPSRANLFAALLNARQQGKTIAFDPNLRPKLWVNGDAMTRSIMEGAAVSDIVLPSFEDEAEWFDDADPDATIERYRSVGCTSIIVKNGEGSVHYRHHEENGVVTVRPLSSVVDTTAAGDSFNAAILAEYGAETPLKQSIKRACQLAGKVVQGKGALVQVTRDDIDL